MRSTNLFCQNSIASFSAFAASHGLTNPFSSHASDCKRKKGGRENAREGDGRAGEQNEIEEGSGGQNESKMSL